MTFFERFLCYKNDFDRYGSGSEPKLCQLGKYKLDAGAKYRAGTFTTFMRLKVAVAILDVAEKG